MAGGSVGMYLRDYFAIHSPELTHDSWEAKSFAHFMGRVCPLVSEDRIGSIQWWSELEAKLRYMRADAMLAERSKS
jgi:hypothetical protein